MKLRQWLWRYWMCCTWEYI